MSNVVQLRRTRSRSRSPPHESGSGNASSVVNLRPTGQQVAPVLKTGIIQIPSNRPTELTDGKIQLKGQAPQTTVVSLDHKPEAPKVVHLGPKPAVVSTIPAAQESAPVATLPAAAPQSAPAAKPETATPPPAAAKPTVPPAAPAEKRAPATAAPEETKAPTTTPAATAAAPEASTTDITASDGTIFTLLKVNPKSAEMSSYTCSKCNKNVSKKSITNHVATKAHANAN